MPPQIPTHLPSAAAPATVWAISCRMAGFMASALAPSLGWPRSMARVYWVRSLLPMEKKLTSRANCRARTAVDGTSTMIPNSTGSASGSLAHSSATSHLTERISSSVAIMGNIMRSLWPLPARRMARTWVRRISGLSSPMRTPRMPSIGFSSRGMGR